MREGPAPREDPGRGRETVIDRGGRVAQPTEVTVWKAVWSEDHVSVESRERILLQVATQKSVAFG